MSDCFQEALAGLADIVGDKHVIAPGSDQEPYVVDWPANGLMNPGKIFSTGVA